ncbi:MAG TPA: transporter substrate-binding domain-containing protein [Archangium sp.]|jgi:hypothetical protein|uniref:transporter substrate-binding domain-containing protein n=1 Tax=Archangium sp. TaxID=1872627 RepID=UPI002EDAD5A3
MSPPSKVKTLVAGCVLALLAACATRPEALPPSRETRVLRVGTSGDYPPFSTLREGQVSGFDSALLEAYASERGYRLEWVRFRWPELVAAARADVHEAAAALGVPAPRDEALTAFFQAQMDAAKRLQLRAPVTSEGPVHSLDAELQPALARISARISALVPRIPGGLDRDTLRRKAREELASTGLEGEAIDRLADALVELGTRR